MERCRDKGNPHRSGQSSGEAGALFTHKRLWSIHYAPGTTQVRLEELTGKTHKQAAIIKCGNARMGRSRRRGPTLNASVGEEQSEEGHK